MATERKPWQTTSIWNPANPKAFAADRKRILDGDIYRDGYPYKPGCYKEVISGSAAKVDRMTQEFLDAMNKRPGFQVISDRIVIPYLTPIRTIWYKFG